VLHRSFLLLVCVLWQIHFTKGEALFSMFAFSRLYPHANFTLTSKTAERMCLGPGGKHGPARRPFFAFGRRPRIGTRRAFPPIARRFRRPRPVRRRHDAVLVFHVHLCSCSEPLPGIPRPVDGPDSGPFIAGWLNEWGGLTAGFMFGAGLGLAGGLLAAVWNGRLPRLLRAAGAERSHRLDA